LSNDLTEKQEEHTTRYQDLLEVAEKLEYDWGKA
jgi:hypothetical protein